VVSAAPTRELLLTTAERLFAEQGIAQVSVRQIAEAAGQANNSAVAYHVGTKADLVLAILHVHNEPVDRLRADMLDAADGSTDLRDHLAAMVLPLTRHLAGLGVPSWYARFVAQATTEPAVRTRVLAEATSTPVMRRALDAVIAHTGDLPPTVALVRAEMARHLIVHTCAERERDLAQGAGSGWEETGELLIDALVGLLAARTAGAGRVRRPR
jgi:AcrR family transcriptional regulator